MMNYYLRKGFFNSHVHFRSPNYPLCDEAFEKIIGATARQCEYAVVMPNSPIIKTVERMKSYRQQILAVARKVAPNSDFKPLMTLYLTKKTSWSDIKRASKIPYFAGWKLYPKGKTTGSQDGVADIRELEEVLKMIDRVGSRLLIHCETTRPGIDDLHTEDIFIMEDLPVIRQMFKGKICLEHCSTFSAINAVLDDDLMWGSITPHHLTGTNMDTENPHNRCKPVWQTEHNRKYLINNVFNSGSKFFAGTDSAPHPESQKSSTNPPNGCFSEPVALQLYFEAILEHFINPIYSYRASDICEGLERFLYQNAADFYGIRYDNVQHITISDTYSSIKDGSDKLLNKNVAKGPYIVVRDNYNKPVSAPSGDDFKFPNENFDGFDKIIPLRAGEKLRFSVHYQN